MFNENEGDCGCKTPIRTTSRRMLVFSAGGAAPGESTLFVATTEAEEQIAPLIVGFRVTVIFHNKSANAGVRVAYTYTDDGCTWATPVPVGNYITANATSVWVTTTANFTRGIRVGLYAHQEQTSTNVELADVTVIIDWDLRS